MGKFIAESTIKRLINSDCKIKGARVGVLGLTFKENVPDLRNTRVVDILAELADYGVEVLVSDAEADPEEARDELGVNPAAAWRAARPGRPDPGRAPPGVRRGPPVRAEGLVPRPGARPGGGREGILRPRGA